MTVLYFHTALQETYNSVEDVRNSFVELANKLEETGEEPAMDALEEEEAMSSIEYEGEDTLQSDLGDDDYCLN